MHFYLLQIKSARLHLQLNCFRSAFEYIVCNTGTHVATQAVSVSVSVAAAVAAAAAAAAAAAVAAAAAAAAAVDLEAHAAYVFAVAVSVAAAAVVAITASCRPILSVYSKLKRGQQSGQ